MDLALLLDCTGSMQQHINAARENVKKIVDASKKKYNNNKNCSKNNSRKKCNKSKKKKNQKSQKNLATKLKPAKR